MDEFSDLLQQHMEAVAAIGDKIEAKEAYLEDLRQYLPLMNKMVANIFELIENPNCMLEMAPEFVVQVLKDILYGIENEDEVFLLDVLRYGLFEIYNYIGTELQSGESNE